MTDFALAPGEASNIALNAYFALKDWALEQPSAGVESRAKVRDLVLGSGDTHGVHAVNSSVGKSFPGARLGQVFTGSTGWNTVSGFGYVLHFERDGLRHAVVAIRGTRPELGACDLLTDARGAHTGFAGFGRVHKGFASAFASIYPQLQREQRAILAADVVHCVGHSLGGAIATLAAGRYAALNKRVRLYTFGSPRVGYRDAYGAFERTIGRANIFRVAHNRDPITMMATYPYRHVLAPYTEPNNFTVNSPSPSITMANHDMTNYAQTFKKVRDWGDVRGLAASCDHSTSKLAQALMADTSMSWFKKLTLGTLAALLTLFEALLGGVARGFYDAVTGIDVVAAMVCDGVKLMGEVGERIKHLLRLAARWADIPVANDAALDDTVIRTILQAMSSRINQVGVIAVQRAAALLQPVPLLIAGSLLISASAL